MWSNKVPPSVIGSLTVCTNPYFGPYRMGRDGVGQDGTRGTSCLRYHIYACIHWWTMWTNCPSPASIATNWPLWGGDVWDGTGHGTQDMGQRGTSSPSWHIYWKKKFGTTTKCSSLKGLRTTIAKRFDWTLSKMHFCSWCLDKWAWK